MPYAKGQKVYIAAGSMQAPVGGPLPSLPRGRAQEAVVLGHRAAASGTPGLEYEIQWTEPGAAAQPKKRWVPEAAVHATAEAAERDAERFWKKL